MYIKIGLVVLTLTMISGCSTRGLKSHKSGHTSQSTTKAKSSSTQHYSKTPKKQKSGYVHPTMKPYTVFGIRYYPTKVRVGEKFRGISSWYGPDFDGKATSSGEIYDMHALTAAHKTLPMNTMVKVTNVDNGKSVVVRINDRGPFVGTRIIDLSNKAAHKIDMVKKGTANVRLEVVGFKDAKARERGSSTYSSTKPSVAPKKSLNYDVYAIQIGSFSKIDGAMKVQEQYDDYRGYHTVIKDTEYNGKRVFRVWLSGFKSEEQARAFKKDSPFPNAFIVGE